MRCGRWWSSPRAAGSEEHPAKGEVLSAAQAIPPRFLENILGELRVHGLVHSRRGADGGYWLARDADEITLAEIIRAVEGPLATSGARARRRSSTAGPSKPLEQVWIALRANIRQVLETVTLAAVVAGELPEPVLGLAEHPEAAQAREPGFASPPESPSGPPAQSSRSSAARRTSPRELAQGRVDDHAEEAEQQREHRPRDDRDRSARLTRARAPRSAAGRRCVNTFARLGVT